MQRGTSAIIITSLFVVGAAAVGGIWYQRAREVQTIPSARFIQTAIVPGYVLIPNTADQFASGDAVDLGLAPGNIQLTGVSVEFDPILTKSTQGITDLLNWLTQQGFTNTMAYYDRHVVTCDGTAAQFEAAFHIQIHQFAIDGARCDANPTDLQVPAQFATIIVGMPLSNCYPDQLL